MGYLRQEDELQDLRVRDGFERQSDEWGITDCDFVVWQPRALWISRIPFDRKHYDDVLKPALRKNYLEVYLPAATAQYNGLLMPNHLKQVHRMKVDI